MKTTLRFFLKSTFGVDHRQKIDILQYAFGEVGGGIAKEYSLYGAFLNVDNFERPLIGMFFIDTFFTENNLSGLSANQDG